MPEEERRRTAYHESGHALLGMLQPGADPVRKITIVPRGRALGVTLSTPDADRYAYTEEYLRGRIIGALGGMAAEHLVYDVITTGSENDLEQVTNIARGMVGRWGMSERVGRLTAIPGDAQRPYGLSAAPATLDVVDHEMRRIVDECYEEACRLLREHRPKLDALAEALLPTRRWTRRPPTPPPGSRAWPRGRGRRSEGPRVSATRAITYRKMFGIHTAPSGRRYG